MPMYEWKCDVCEGELSILRSMDDFKEGPKEAEAIGLKWPNCRHDWYRDIKAATVTRASYLEGQRLRGSGSDSQAYQNLLAASQLSVDKSSMRPDSVEHKEITQTINKLKGKNMTAVKKK